MSSTIINDHEGVCPRCKTNHCEDDNEHDNRIFWVSNTDGTEVCRACIRKEDEDEDEDEEDERLCACSGTPAQCFQCQCSDCGHCVDPDVQGCHHEMFCTCAGK